MTDGRYTAWRRDERASWADPIDGESNDPRFAVHLSAEQSAFVLWASRPRKSVPHHNLGCGRSDWAGGFGQRATPSHPFGLTRDDEPLVIFT